MIQHHTASELKFSQWNESNNCNHECLPKYKQVLDCLVTVTYLNKELIMSPTCLWSAISNSTIIIQEIKHNSFGNKYSPLLTQGIHFALNISKYILISLINNPQGLIYTTAYFFPFSNITCQTPRLLGLYLETWLWLALEFISSDRNLQDNLNIDTRKTLSAKIQLSKH